MDCDQVRVRFSEWLAGEPAGPDREAVKGHLTACRACAEELAALQEAWELLGRWPGLEPAPGVGRRLVRRIRWMIMKDAVLAAEGWKAASLAAFIAVALSIGMALFIPYRTLVDLCRQVVAGLAPEPGAFLLAGIAYSLVPLALGALVAWRGRSPGAWLGATEATLLFLVLLGPYVVVQCRGFPLPAQASFLSGLALGALGGGLIVGRLLPGAGADRWRSA